MEIATTVVLVMLVVEAEILCQFVQVAKSVHLGYPTTYRQLVINQAPTLWAVICVILKKLSKKRLWQK